MVAESRERLEIVPGFRDIDAETTLALFGGDGVWGDKVDGEEDGADDGVGEEEGEGHRRGCEIKSSQGIHCVNLNRQLGGDKTRGGDQLEARPQELLSSPGSSTRRV